MANINLRPLPHDVAIVEEPLLIAGLASPEEVDDFLVGTDQTNILDRPWVDAKPSETPFIAFADATVYETGSTT